MAQAMPHAPNSLVWLISQQLLVPGWLPLDKHSVRPVKWMCKKLVSCYEIPFREISCSGTLDLTKPCLANISRIAERLLCYLSDKISTPAFLHCRRTGVYLSLSGGGQASIVKGFASHFRQLCGQSAWCLFRWRPPHLPLLVVAGVTAARHCQELRLLRSTTRCQRVILVQS